MRYTKRIELLFTYLCVNASHDTVTLTNKRMNDLCKTYGVNKNRAIEISNGNIKLKK